MVSLGYIYEPPSIPDRAGSLRRGLSITRAFEPSEHPRFLDHIGGIWTQHVNACTGFAAAKGAVTTARYLGIEAPELSAFSVYTPARRLDRPDSPLVDTGAKVAQVERIWNTIGPCEEWRWPSFTLTGKAQKKYVNREPAGLDRSSIVANGQRWRRELRLDLKRIVAGGPRLVQRVLHSLHQHQYVLMALPVNTEFERGSGVLPAQRAKGWHLVGIIDWRRVGDEYQLLMVNSWGAHWGDDGLAWISFELACQASAAYYIQKVGPS